MIIDNSTAVFKLLQAKRPQLKFNKKLFLLILSRKSHPP